MSLSQFTTLLDAFASEFEAFLETLLAAKPAKGEIARPARLLEAMRYASLADGKGLRPFPVARSTKLLSIPAHETLAPFGKPALRPTSPPTMRPPAGVKALALTLKYQWVILNPDGTPI